MSNAPVLVLGSGLAGWTVIKEFRKHDTQTPLMLLTADSGDAYPKPALSTAFAQNKLPAQLRNGLASELAAPLNLQLQTLTRALTLDLTKKELHTDQGVFAYSRLVLANGADPIRIPLEGDAADSVLSVNQLADYARLRERLHPGMRVLIMGAGLIGCEFANDLGRAGFKVQVADPASRALSALLPEQASLQLQQALTALSVAWYFGDSVIGLNKHSGALQATLKSGATLDTDLVLSAIGLRPQISWLKDAGLQCDKGVLVNPFLQTSDPHVYALGDVAQYASANNRLLPYVMPIMTAARALGASLAGTQTEVVFPVMPVAVKTPDLPLLLAPPAPGVTGEWQLLEEGVWKFMAVTAECQGFVLAGKQTSQRSKALQWLVP